MLNLETLHTKIVLTDEDPCVISFLFPLLSIIAIVISHFGEGGG